MANRPSITEVISYGENLGTKGGTRMNGGTCCCYEGDVSRCPIHRRDDVKVIDVAAARCAQVEASRKELQDWKESALLIFREWDKVAKVVLKNGGKLGESMAGESIRVFKELEAAKVAAAP
jgi:hypothetical protein